MVDAGLQGLEEGRVQALASRGPTLPAARRG